MTETNERMLAHVMHGILSAILELNTKYTADKTAAPRAIKSPVRVAFDPSIFSEKGSLIEIAHPTTATMTPIT
jgi:hypothetical protein